MLGRDAVEFESVFAFGARAGGGGCKSGAGQAMEVVLGPGFGDWGQLESKPVARPGGLRLVGFWRGR